MPIDDCLKELGDRLTDQQKYDLLAELDEKGRQRNRKRPFENRGESYRKVAEEMAHGEQMKAIHAARTKALQIAANTRIIEKIDRFDSSAEGMAYAIAGGSKSVPGGRMSTDASFRALRNGIFGAAANDLEEAGLTELAGSRTIDREIVQELWELDRPDGQPGISGNREAEKIAGILHKYYEQTRGMQNRAGAWIRKLLGYAGRQTHDVWKIRRAKYDQWHKDVIDQLDWDRTFGDHDPDEFMREVYRDLTTGQRQIAEGMEEQFIKTGVDSSPLAEQVSERRILIFKDADAAYEYNQKYGRGGVMENFFHQMEHAARNIAVMEDWGPNPRQGFDSVRLLLLDRARDNPQEYDRLRGKTFKMGFLRNLENEFAHVTGEANIPGSHVAARVSAGVRAWMNMAMLGGTFIKALPDLHFKAAALTFNGHNALSAYGGDLTRFLDGFSSKEKRTIARLAGVGFSNKINNIAARMGSWDDLPGALSKAQAKFFKWNLMQPWDDWHKTDVVTILSHNLALNRRLPWDRLDDGLRRSLAAYDIDGRDWDVYRTMAHREADGNRYVSPDKVRDVPDEVFRDSYAELKKVGLTRSVSEPSHPRIQAVRDRLERKLQTYFVSEADYAVPTPGARETAFLLRGYRPGTAAGEAIRFLAQFKSFALTVTTKAWGRRLYGQGRPDLLGLVGMAVHTTIMGYLSMSAWDIARNRTPRNPFEPGTVAAAMLAGGGAAYLGDFLMGEYDRFGRTFFQSVEGPALSRADEAIRLIWRMKKGDDFGASLLRFGINNTPFINLFYTRMGLDYLFLYAWQEALNPGYFRRAERRMKRENNQSFYIDPRKFTGR